jgi:putative IMPACT (imprinted ancient) family translation regulator
MLVALPHSGIGDVVAVVTRYFGGVKLGTGGLARAYAGSVQAALGVMPRAEHVATTPCSLVATYAQVDALLKMLARNDVSVTSQRFEADVTLELLVPLDRVEALRDNIRDITRGLVHLRQNARTGPAHSASSRAAPGGGT